MYTNRKYSTYLSCHSSFDNIVFQKVFGSCPSKKIRKNIYDLTEWQSNPKHYIRFGGIHNWRKHRENSQIQTAISELSQAIEPSYLRKQNMDEHLQIHNPDEFTKHMLPLVKKYPDTRFIFYYPPYSIYKYAIDVQASPHIFTQYKGLVKSIALETELLPNAEVFWFGDKEFVKNIENYKDLTHYHASFNNLFLNDFKTNNSRIDINNYKFLLDKLEVDANSVDLDSFLLELTR